MNKTSKAFEIIALTFLGKRTGEFELRIAADNPFGYVVAGTFSSRREARAAAKKF